MDNGGSWDSGHVKNDTVVMSVIVEVTMIHVPKERGTVLRLLRLLMLHTHKWMEREAGLHAFLVYLHRVKIKKLRSKK